MKKSISVSQQVVPCPVWVIGSYSKEGIPNLMTAGWCGVCCSVPSCIAVSLREATLTYENIMERKAFTVNLPSLQYISEADYVGMESGRNADKFSKLGLTAVNSEIVDAPYVAEFPLVLECKVLHTFKIGLHTQFIGEILDMKIEEMFLDDTGHVAIEALNPLVYIPQINAYHTLGGKVGQSYAIGNKHR